MTKQKQQKEQQQQQQPQKQQPKQQKPKQRYAQPKLGQPAPDFELSATNGGAVKLSDYRGRKVVLYFYPKDMTTACTQQACDFRDASSEYEGLNAVVLGISTDELKRHYKFTEKYELPFLLLADPDHRVCELYGVWQEKQLYGRTYMGIVRSTFLIDEEGKLAQEWRNIRVKGHVDIVKQALLE
ncbi:thioredoxin-dependent thiol peroxidase [Cohnella sp. CIP 111063]|jgi:Peroxiredoxin|uniref:thioredoxin-dependent thiol peroxidase n=1 Tax=unclassified Cohnella TaxID=2636738 RepID=UPI000B8C1D98|nr:MULTISPECIES: thioredoxin-dependent thiol peroxidase [unclassified Cohnella]OXS56884.1 thioredoxin-dependent thiol peroxidase [Cohnella sp. CIP 111063]PRX69723.1 peroxiredoxin Q/BCP [Cohnella sp. SGD-V74]